MLPTFHLRLLGRFEARLGERPLTALQAPQLQSLVARLALPPGWPQPRQQLAYLYWPDSPEPRARANLRRLVHDLRLALPGAERYLDLAGSTLAWRAEGPYALDVAQFQAAAAQADTPEALA